MSTPTSSSNHRTSATTWHAPPALDEYLRAEADKHGRGWKSAFMRAAVLEKLERDNPGVVTAEMREVPADGSPRVSKPLDEPAGILGGKLKAARVKLKLSQHQAAAKARTDRQTWSMVELGRLKVDRDVLANMAAAVDLKLTGIDLTRCSKRS